MIEYVFEDRCTGCGKCEELCPTGTFDLRADGVPVIARQAECHTCYLCEAHCPADALYVGPLRTPQPTSREEILALDVLGNFRRALGFDRHEPGSYCYAGNEDSRYAPEGSRTQQNPNSPDAAIYASLAIARERGLIEVHQRPPITNEIVP
ncbi:4Fe-4S dicluster domain-containing protein [Azoarcus indigens]|uniref:NAD-dependent dihydropyrimidine dehydrogenase PreA subunit n=1 Tax=Azoarcus indigens TaxID=29545 RepID=A0A4R6EEY1_9RHOO|nr:ferredoxin family protein [Azoarcus indigens]NMG67717.1 4Fe-4S dicluster domain-containing protein [Azoarcus indigens]TDN56835.1 NAD-dependent dihydropyrimidine dehydrogenase PreA subunit [Azoarcus indigens]